jgi:hypothetical protein
MTTYRIAAEIAAEIERLKLLLPRLPHKAAEIQAQIDVLNDGMTESDVYDIFGEEEDEDYDDDVFMGAMDAFRWVNSKSLLSLADDWEPLCDK